MAKHFSIPFAEDGDRSPIPDTTQGDGSVSYQQGYGFDYERPEGDPDRKLIERPDANQLYHDITAAIGEIQKYGAALWTADAAPYPSGAQVYHSGGVWVAVVATSQAPGAGDQWVRAPSRFDIVPIGVAFPYFGNPADIPSNYAICNGQNGTPDLTNRFIVGAGGLYAAGTTGGSTTTAESGQHNHPVTVAGHALTVDQIPPHSHNNRLSQGSGGGVSGASVQIKGYGNSYQWNTEQDGGGGQAHSHGASSANAGQHSHAATPPYYAAIWIMRMS